MAIGDPMSPLRSWTECGGGSNLSPCTGDIGTTILGTAQPTAVDPSVVPEPTSMLLLGSGILGLAAKHRRRQRR